MTSVIVTVLVGVFVVYFFFQYSTEMEQRIYTNIDEYEEIDMHHLCIQVLCNGIYYDDKFYGIDEETKIISFEYTENVIFPSEILRYGNVSLRKDLSFVVPIAPAFQENHDYIIYFFIDIRRFVPTFVGLYLFLLTVFNLTVGIIVHVVVAREKIENDIETSKDKAFLQFDNLMFYIENLNHEVNSPLFILSRKIKEMRNKIEGNDKNFEIIFNSIEQINAVMHRTREVKKINKTSEDRTLYDLIESTIMTIGVMRSENITSITDKRLDNYFLDQNLMSNGTFINILTNHIKNSIEAYADELVSDFVEFKKNKVVFTFSDNGNGIPDKIKNKIFEKGFSTKGDKSIRGSGMSINRYIIESVGGSVKVNDVKNGTQFAIKIPVKENKDK